MSGPAEETIVPMTTAGRLLILLLLWVPGAGAQRGAGPRVWSAGFDMAASGKLQGPDHPAPLPDQSEIQNPKSQIGRAAGPESLVNGRRAVVLESQEARLVIDLAGGSIVDFHLRTQGLNPLQWEEPGPKTAPRPMGHFLCLDRWGSPSPAEQKNGMPFHGEASRVEWQLLREPHREGDWVAAEMGATLPLAGLKVERRIRLSTRGAFFTVRDAVTNTNRLGRVYNMVQHATIGPPFLDESTVVDANARKGFMQNSPLPYPEEPAVYWPQALKEGQPVDLRHLRDDPEPNVVSYTLDTDYGWATASSPTDGLLIGYLWKSAEYPWFNVWRDVKNGKPAARGLEFGTTGLHQPFSVLVAKGRIFDRPLFTYLDAGQTVARSYAAFLVKLPADYRGVADLSYAAGRLVLTERGTGTERNLALEVGDLFSW